MSDPARSKALAAQARGIYLKALLKGLSGIHAALGEAGHQLLQMAAVHAVQVARRDSVGAWLKHGGQWQTLLASGLRHAANGEDFGLTHPPSLDTPPGRLSLVENRTIEREISSSRLALAIMDRASWEFTDLRTRIQILEQTNDLPAQAVLRAPVVAGLVMNAWQQSGLGSSEWQLLQGVIHEEFAHLLSETYHELNHWLVEHGVLPEVDLRPFIRRSPEARQGALLAALSASGVVVNTGSGASSGAGSLHLHAGPVPLGAAPAAQPASAEPLALSPAGEQAADVLRHLQRIVGTQVPALAPALAGGNAPQPLGAPASPRLHAAISR
ncbi:MAG TPA: DUF1631 family protein, partial [Burkholderiaceae bacterium]